MQQCLLDTNGNEFMKGEMYEIKGRVRYFICYSKRKGVKVSTWAKSKEKANEQLNKFKNFRNNEEIKNSKRGENRTIEGVAFKLLTAARARARKYNAKCTLKKDWICKKLKEGCAVTKFPFQIGVFNKKRSAYAPSIDRLDSNDRNYTPENCELRLIQVNIARNHWSDEESLPILKSLVHWMENKLIDKSINGDSSIKSIETMQ